MVRAWTIAWLLHGRSDSPVHQIDLMTLACIYYAQKKTQKLAWMSLIQHDIVKHAQIDTQHVASRQQERYEGEFLGQCAQLVAYRITVHDEKYLEQCKRSRNRVVGGRSGKRKKQKTQVGQLRSAGRAAVYMCEMYFEATSGRAGLE